MRFLSAFLVLSLSLTTSVQTCVAQVSGMDEIISARGDKLYEGDREFRFVSFNIPNLQVVEDNFAPGYDGPFLWPNEFEITDALESVRQMGGTVVRTYVLSVVREGSGMGDTVHVLGPGKFNEEAFRVLDLLVKTARDKGIRVFIPFVDQWHWMGGRAQYAGFRGKEPDEFWTDEQVISDFEKTIRFLLNRRNTLTGVLYKDDPTIFGWETGNEISSPPLWTKRIAALIKSIDSKHLVIDGNSLNGLQQQSIDNENVDVVTTHHYPRPGQNMVESVRQAIEKSRGKKPYYVGEFGFIPLAEMQDVLDLVVDEGVSGALLWSLRFHHRDGGFYWHSEPLGEVLYKAYHWPGFANGQAYQEAAVMKLMRSKAFEIRGIPEPPLEAPAAPTLLTIDDVSAISWQGSAGAAEYDVFRANKNDGPWELVGPRVVDSDYQYVPLFQDQTAQPGKAYFYRVAAKNSAGVSPRSNVIGPVRVEHHTLVDECEDLSLVASHEQVEPTTRNDRGTREDKSRLRISPGGHVVYDVEEPILQWTVTAYMEDDESDLSVSCRADKGDFAACEFTRSGDAKSSTDYGYLRHVELRGTTLPVGTRSIRIESPVAAGTAAQLSRVVIRYGANQ